MSWKVNMVLLYGKIRKPIDIKNVADLHALRKKSDKAARVGSLLFDKKIPVSKITDTHADGVPVRIYDNTGEKNQRVIIYYHGGGFVLYGIYSHDYVCRRLCAMNNCMVVSVDYRLAPEHTFPAAHEDAFTAIKWVRNNISSYGGNPDNLVVAGDSAGGNLSACMAVRCKRENIPLKAQVLVYPWIDGKLNNPSIERNGTGYLLEREVMFWFQNQYTPRKEDHCVPEISPCYEKDLSGLAPAFILTAEYDPLLDDGWKYYNQLNEAGNVVHYKEYPGMFHSFFSLPGVHEVAMSAYHDIHGFLQQID
ncbi:MAG: alpha/beta hydrolase [Chitinophagales bacterium]|nr:alpha/beta hydrolase [Chitinophagales bacterium]